jgi:myosin protein heavy chain
MQERRLQIAAAEAADSHKAAHEYRRRLRELEEQIQADDRAERLEVSLKNTQDRADEMEFQLAKVKQVGSCNPSFLHTITLIIPVECIRKA